MPYLLYLFFILAVSCNNNTAISDESTSSSSDTLTTTVPIQGLATTISPSSENVNEEFDKMPLLATYINELPFYTGCNYGELSLALPNSERLIFVDNKIKYPEGGGDYSSYDKLVQFNETTACFKGGWEGTAGSQAWTCTYQLLSTPPSNPMILIAGQSLEESRDFEGYMEDQNELIEELLDQNVSGDAKQIAERMIERDYIDRRSLKNNFEDHSISFWVWQKKDGEWQNITTSLFSEKMYQQLFKYFPFFSKDPSSKDYKYDGFYLKENFYTKEALILNKNNWLNWFGIDQLDALTFDLKTEGKNILFECSKNKTIRWEWNGEVYHLNNLPKKTPWLNNPCSTIDFYANKEHYFKGKIGVHEIEMIARFNQEKISGEYWYSHKKNSKFPIEGAFKPKADEQLTFYRIKKGKQRESFVCYFIDCQLKGWWQHEGTKKIEQFELTLIKK